MPEKIQAIMIVEIAGRPPEHIRDALQKHLAVLKGYKGVKLISEIYSDPKYIESSDDMYTCFAELEIQCESLLKLLEVVFDFMPSSIEVVEPAELTLDVSESTSFINTLAGRLHQYDEVAKIAQIRTQQLAQQLQLVQQQMQKARVSPITSVDQPKQAETHKKPVKKKAKKK